MKTRMFAASRPSGVFNNRVNKCAGISKTSVNRYALTLSQHIRLHNIKPDSITMPQILGQTSDLRTASRRVLQLTAEDHLITHFKYFDVSPRPAAQQLVIQRKRHQTEPKQCIELKKRGSTDITEPPEKNPTLRFSKDDRQFTSFWKKQIVTKSSDNRRHIPLVANMKAMLTACYETAHDNQQLPALRAILINFNLHLSGEEPKLDIEATVKSTLKNLSNLRSHIFLGHKYTNMIIGSLSDVLLMQEPKVFSEIDKAKNSRQVQKIVEDWYELINKQSTDKNSCSVINKETLPRDATYPRRSQHAMCQLADIVSCLTAVNYPSLADFKAEAKSLLRNIRDSYATDISDAGDDDVRKWQNAHWLPCSREIVNLTQLPSIAGLKKLLEHIITLENDFSQLMSDKLNDQGFQTTPEQLLMKSPEFLRQTENRPVLDAMTALLQQP